MERGQIEVKSFPFLDLNFTPIAIDHQKLLEHFLKNYPQRIYGYTFASLLAWSVEFIFAWVFIEKETLLLSTYIAATKERHLLQPIGEFSTSSQKKLLEAISKNPYPIKIYAVGDQFIEKHQDFCSHFEDHSERDLANYVYKSADLASLAGKNYEKKRNLISQAEKLYHWTVEPLTGENLFRFQNDLINIGKKKQSQITVTLNSEKKALNMILTHFKQLHQKGFVICINGIPAAFSIYEELNPNTEVVHFEKAERKFKGLYQIINRETAKAILQEGYEFINREEDLGVEGLRKAKMSYHPIELVTSHILVFTI